jgi:hypothetical protein
MASSLTTNHWASISAGISVDTMWLLKLTLGTMHQLVCSSSFQLTGNNKLKRIQGWDNWLGVPMNESFRAQTWGYIPSNTNIGTTFDKALYRGYTGPDFAELSEQPDWLGFNGPILRGEVGDMIEVRFPPLYAILTK